MAKKIIMGLLLLATATPLATTVAFANARGGAYIQCNGGPRRPSGAGRIADSLHLHATGE